MMTEPQNWSADFLRNLMRETAAVPLRAVREMQAEFIQAPAAMTQLSLGQMALNQQEEAGRK